MKRSDYIKSIKRLKYIIGSVLIPLAFPIIIVPFLFNSFILKTLYFLSISLKTLENLIRKKEKNIRVRNVIDIC